MQWNIYESPSDNIKLSYKGESKLMRSNLLDVKGNLLPIPENGQEFLIEDNPFGDVVYTAKVHEDGKTYGETGKTLVFMNFDQELKRYQATGFACVPYPFLDKTPIPK